MHREFCTGNAAAGGTANMRLQLHRGTDFPKRSKRMPVYAHPETLVSTDWVAEHATDFDVRVVEVDVDTKAYDEAHVPGAIAWAWNTQLCDTLRRDILSKAQFEELMAASGVTPETKLIIYGDNNNWFAAWALWQAKIYGHRDV